MLETKTESFSEIYKICGRLTDVYCENDHLIKTKRVNDLLFKSQHLEKLIEQISANFAKYDGKTNIEANGYRSIVKVATLLMKRCEDRGGEIVSKVANVNHVNEYLSRWSDVLNGINNVVEIALEIMDLDSNEMLYPDKPNCKTAKVIKISEKLLSMDVTPFYGEMLGFHLKGDCPNMVRAFNIGMACYSEIFEGTVLQKMRNLKNMHFGLYYASSDDNLAKKVVEVSRSKQIGFAQSFCNMGELPIVKMIKPLQEVSTSYSFPICYESLETPQTTIETTNLNMKFEVPIPSSHIDKNFVQARLVSNYRTSQMLGSCLCIHGFICRCQYAFAKDVIIFHVHGGGFVSQTSESHLDYLHQWSSALDVPILSIDYSLAPEAPFPRALEEVLYCYVWMLNNFESLGTTGKKIILAGDSAGGNLITSLTLKTITNCIHIPDALLLSYASLLTQFYPSPSRLLTMMDPLLMTPTMVKCLNAYTDPNYLDSLPRSLESELEMGTSEQNIFLSPLLAEQNLLKHFPKTVFIETDVDACLDENVQFCSKLLEAGIDAKMEVLSGLPHGFLGFCSLSKDCQIGVDHVTQVFCDLISNL